MSEKGKSTAVGCAVGGCLTAIVLCVVGVLALFVLGWAYERSQIASALTEYNHASEVLVESLERIKAKGEEFEAEEARKEGFWNGVGAPFRAGARAADSIAEFRGALLRWNESVQRIDASDCPDDFKIAFNDLRVKIDYATRRICGEEGNGFWGKVANYASLFTEWDELSEGIFEQERRVMEIAEEYGCEFETQDEP